MTRTPPEPPEEELDELDDEAIVAQQSAAHAPQRRAQVKVESRSVVVADEDAEATRQLQVYTEGSGDPTLVVRDRERQALAQALDELPVRGRRKSWATLAIWGGAGLLALGLGAVLGTLQGGSGTPTKAAVSAVGTPSAPASPAPTRPVVAVQGDKVDAAPEPSASSASEPALAPDQLPVEKRAPHRAVRRYVRPRSHAAAKPSPPKTQPDNKGAIPSGI